VSKATISVTARALYSHKEMSNRWVVSPDRKTAMEARCRSDKIRQTVQTRAAATGKAQSLTVDSRVRLTISDEDELERSRW